MKKLTRNLEALHLFRIPGLPGIISEESIGPCRSCGGFLFWVGNYKFCCVNCVKPKRGEKILGKVDMAKRLATIYRETDS